jgi:hypothetical protein
MIKNFIIFVLFVAFALAMNFPTVKECPKQNEMVDGCVMQKLGGTWIRTCG